MPKKQAGKKRVTKDQWLSKALEFLEVGGIDSVRIESLAKALGVSKSGFYWHFRDRKDLLNAMLHYWSQEFTEVVTDNPKLQGADPKETLYQVMKIVQDYDL